jgi:hypothetical protein
VSVPLSPTTPAEARQTASLPTQVNDWSELTEVARAAVYPVIGWLAYSIVAAFVAASTFDTSFGAGLANSTSFSGITDRLVAATYGVVSTIFAGFGYHVSASAGGASAGVDLWLVPIGSLLVIAWLAARGARAAASSRPVSGTGPTLIRITFVAGAIVGSMLIVSLVISAAFSSGFGSPTSAFAGEVAAGGGPSFSSVLFAAFPIVWIGAAAGSAAATRGAGLVPASAGIFLRRYSAAIVAVVGGYAVAMIVLWVLYVAVFVIYVLANGGSTDLGVIVRLVPLMLPFVPNVAAVFAVLGTGAQLTTTGSSGLVGSALSIGQLDVEWIILAIGSLCLPGLITGVILYGRDRMATPAVVAIAGIGVAIVVLLVGNIALPGASYAAGGSPFGVSGNSRLTFDLAQALLVGGAAIVATTFVGFRLGGGFWSTLVARVPILGAPIASV